MTIQVQIERILNDRKKLCERLTERKKRLQELLVPLKTGFPGILLQCKNISDENLRKNYITVLSQIDTRSTQGLINGLIRNIDTALSRFSRDYISIATVGKERQGKSRFLQSVGALDNSIIPAYDAISCTGATSIIWNSSDMPKGSVRATISFRPQNELVSLVSSYIKVLSPDYLEEAPLEFDDIGAINLAILSLKAEEGNPYHASALKQLTVIVEHFEEIRDLFGASPLTLTNPDLIKTYVAQNNGKAIDDPDVEFYYKYLAVKRADIYCPFFVATGKVRLVDTVGIGATQLGIEQDMLDTVDRECDAAIVVTRPISGIQKSDQEIYNGLRETFKKRDPSKWLFYLVNHYVGQNDNTVAAFCEDIKKAGWSVADARIVNASDPYDVRDGFLLPLLDKLLPNMNAIDAAYLKELDEKEDVILKKLDEFLAQLPTLEEIDVTGMQGAEAYEKGTQCFNRMTADLSNAVREWGRIKNQPNMLLWNQVQAILNDLDSFIPSAETIDRIADKCGWLLGPDIWNVVLHNVRNKITDRFIKIDDVLEKETLAFKNSLVRSLYDELRNLTPSGSKTPEASADEEAAEESAETCDMVQWLRTMIDDVLSADEQFEQIRKGFNFLYQFTFNTRAQLIQEVRRQLYIINPICDEYANPNYNFRRPCGDAVYFHLTSRMSVIEDELRYHLARLYRTPNQAFYAAAEEFYDRLTFAADLSGNQVINMSHVWGSFFQKYSTKLWQSEVGRFEEVNKLVQMYQDAVSALQDGIQRSREGR